MTMRSILVPITGHDADTAVLETARRLGETFGAHIAVACIRPDPTLVLQYTDGWNAPTLLDSAVAAAEQHSASVARKSKALFDRWRADHNLPIAPPIHSGISVSHSDYIGTAGEVLRDVSRFADLIAMRTLGSNGPLDGDLMLEAILFEAGRPVLLVPKKPVDSLVGTVLVAWDGGREALHAVTAAMPILCTAGSVRILTVDGNDATGAERLMGYLAWHGIAASVSAVSRGSKSIGETVIHEGQEAGASLLVMGGYHHGRTRELLFGGTTRRIIAQTEIAVLLAH